MIMAAKRHIHPAFLVLMAVILVFPPLTSAVAEGLGIELAHHHCQSHEFDTSHTDTGLDADHTGRHGNAETDPFQCDQCHIALAAITSDIPLGIGAETLSPEAHPAMALLPVRTPPAFKPPIA